MEQQITLNSKDESHYNYISQTIPAMSYYEKVSVCVTSLVTNCNIRILNQHDYIEFVCIDDEVGGVVNKFYFGEWTTSYLRNAEGLISIMSDTLKEWGIEPYASKCGTITFCSTKQFYITDCTYNVKLVMGLYNRIGDNTISADNPLQAVKCSLDEYIKIYGKELGNQISVARMHLHAVEACLNEKFRRRAESLGHFFYLSLVHAVHEGGGVEVEARGCAQRHASASAPVRHVAAVTQLDGSLCSLGVDGVSQFSQFGYDFGADPQLVLEAQSALAYCGIGYGSHSYAAAGNCRMIIEQFLARTVAGAHRLKCGRTYCPVAQSDGPQLKRCEYFAHFLSDHKGSHERKNCVELGKSCVDEGVGHNVVTL